MDSVQIKLLDERYKKGVWPLPTFQSPAAAAIDLRAAVDGDVSIPPGKAVLIPTGFAIYIGDPNVCAKIYPRSGQGHKQGLVLGNGVGVIDADYQGELFVSVLNRNHAISHPMDLLTGNPQSALIIKPGQRIAQLAFEVVLRPEFEVVKEFPDLSERGNKGFGSTGE